MNRSIHFLLFASLCTVAFLGHESAQAQFRYNPYTAYQRVQGAQQNAYAQQLLATQQGQVYGTNYGVPIYAGAVNNYYNPGYNNYPNYYTPPVYTPPVAAYNPYVNPYAPATPGYGVNPYSPVDPSVSNPYSPYNPYNPYSSYGAGSVLTGTADVMRAYGQQANLVQQAFVVREQAKQAQIDTKWKQFEFEMKVKAATPTYSQEQARIGREVLTRIQKHSLPGEISSGKALNLLLDDLRKFPGKKISLEPLVLSDEVFGHLNVTKGNFGMGLLREPVKINWPTALNLTAKQRQDMEKQIQVLVKGANSNDLDNNVLADLRKQIDLLREGLIKRVNETPDSQYMDGKRFLQELYESTRALETGEASNSNKFQRFIEEGKGGRSVQDIAEYMVKEGLRFGPATAQDEAAYRAVHSALASYDIAINSQFGTDGKD